jgi:hypothetical protein
MGSAVLLKMKQRLIRSTRVSDFLSLPSSSFLVLLGARLSKMAILVYRLRGDRSASKFRRSSRLALLFAHLAHIPRGNWVTTAERFCTATPVPCSAMHLFVGP